jgi:hypothetical protein
VKQQNRFRELLRALPVSVNNLADPTILRDSTAAKLDTLCRDGHTGPVALITKGNMATPWWRERLPGWAAKLNLFVFASISELPRSMEPAGTEHRYRTLTAAREAGCKAISYVRPIIHTVNDSPETIRRIFTRSVDAGANAIISSGFRGDDEVVESSGLTGVEAPDGQHWSKTLKLTPQGTADYMRSLAEELRVPYWTRTMCAVSALSGMKNSLNPYHLAPKFVGCEVCPIKGTCADRAQFLQPVPGSIDLLRHLGFQVEVHTASERYSRCDVERRQQCSLCCTNCPVAPANMGVPYVNIRAHDGSIPSWGEMSFARFLTGGMLATDPAIKPGENSNVRLHPRFRVEDGRSGVGDLYGVNSWMVWSEYLPANKCLRCKYCFLSMFEDTLPPELQVTVGASPSSILDWEESEVRSAPVRHSLAVLQP